MIPIRDTKLSRSYPIVNNTLIGFNVVLFLVQLAQGPDLDRFIYIYGLVPARYAMPQVAAYFSTAQQLFSFLSFMFLHGGFLHLLGNMWTLHIFGDNVEDHLGPVRYLIFYLLSGIASGIAHLVLNYYSNIPTIGASGAIAGVMGAYFILHPRSKILTLIPIFFIPYFIEVPAFLFLGFWFVLQFINATSGVGGIAWWAHIGGFVLGIVFLKLFDWMPAAGRVGAIQRKRRSHRLQMIRPERTTDDLNLYGTIRISWYEALSGTRKLVNVPRGFKGGVLRVVVPRGVRDGSLLRLKGMGKPSSSGERGDLLLRVIVES